MNSFSSELLKFNAIISLKPVKVEDFVLVDICLTLLRNDVRNIFDLVEKLCNIGCNMCCMLSK